MPDTADRFDFIIIGAGITGSMVARELSRFKADILLIEKESDVGMGTSAANSFSFSGRDPPRKTCNSGCCA